jgi:hypothetical protein
LPRAREIAAVDSPMSSRYITRLPKAVFVDDGPEVTALPAFDHLQPNLACAAHRGPGAP